MNTTTEIPGQLIWKSVWLLTNGRRRSTGQRDDSGPWRDRAGQCEISSRYSEWGAISNFSIVYSWNCPFTTFGQQLSVAETTETEALAKSGLLYYTHTHTRARASRLSSVSLPVQALPHLPGLLSPQHLLLKP